MKNKFFFIIFGFLLTFFLISGIFNKVGAANFSFDKTNVNVGNGQTFDIEITLNPGSDSIYSTDIYILYDSSILKPTTVTAGSLFPTVSNDLSQSGKVYIAAMVNDPTSAVSSSGTIAKITFQALKEGSTSLSFDCSSSKIIKNDANGTNVLVCSQNATSSVTIGNSGGGFNNQNNNNNLNELPQTGIVEDFLKLGLSGLFLVIIGIFLKKSFGY